MPHRLFIYPSAVCLFIFFPIGCGNDAQEPAKIRILDPEPIQNRKNILRPARQIPPVPFGESAVLFGYTLSVREEIAPGTIIEATLFFRSRKRQDGDFQVTLGIAGEEGTWDWVSVPVSTDRWVLQHSFLGKEEVFWAHGRLRIPLGWVRSEIDLTVGLKRRTPGSEEFAPLGSGIRFRI